MTPEPEMLAQLRANVGYFDNLFGDRDTRGTSSFFDVAAQREMVAWIDAHLIERARAA